MIQLREYQKKALAIIWQGLTGDKEDDSNILISLPTGAGKTVIFSELVKNYHASILILTHRKILVNQIAGVIDNKTNNIYIGTIQGYKYNINPALIIIDECHAVDYERGRYKKLIDIYKNSSVIGFTATPFRLNNGLIYGNNKIWNKINYTLNITTLIKQGYLCPYRVIIPIEFKDNESLRNNITDKEIAEIMQKQYLIDAVVDSYNKFKRNKVIIFAVDIQHAEILKKHIPNSEVIHSKLKNKEKQNILYMFKNNIIDCLININMLTEGFDDTEIDTIILARPTKSIALHRQAVGRGLRLHENKKDCLIIDLVSNFWRCGDLSDEVENKKNKPKDHYYVCSECFNVTFDSTKTCGYCGHQEPIITKLGTLQAKGRSSITAHEYKEIINNCNDATSLVIGCSTRFIYDKYRIKIKYQDAAQKNTIDIYITNHNYIKIFNNTKFNYKLYNVIDDMVKHFVEYIKYKKIRINNNYIYVCY